MCHESDRHEREREEEQHREDADNALDARAFRNAPRHAERRDAVAEMEDCCEHADRVENDDDRVREIAVEELIAHRDAADALRVDAEIEDVPDEERYEVPCRPALEREHPVAHVAEAAGVVVRLEGDVDAVDRMEQQRDGDAEDFKAVEDRFRDEFHHREAAVQRLRAAERRSIRHDMLEDDDAEDQQADERMQATQVKSYVIHSIPPIISREAKRERLCSRPPLTPIYQ